MVGIYSLVLLVKIFENYRVDMCLKLFLSYVCSYFVFVIKNCL